MTYLTIMPKMKKMILKSTLEFVTMYIYILVYLQLIVKPLVLPKKYPLSKLRLNSFIELN